MTIQAQTAQTPHELATDLDSQLTAAVRLAATRAEHVRLIQMQSVLADLRALLPTTPATQPEPASSPVT